MAESKEKTWKQISPEEWERSDGATVRYDEAANSMYAMAWKKGHKGWMAYRPGERFPISYNRKDSGFNIIVKYSSAEKAMKAIDR